MGIPVSISELLNNHTIESTRIEYKASFNPDSIIRTICAFANDIDNIGGGYIVIGVEEENGLAKFPLKGLNKQEIDNTLKKLHEYCHYIEPFYEPVVEPIFFMDAYLIVIWAYGGHGRPYKTCKSVTNNQSLKHYYIRKFSSTVIADSEEEKELFYISSNIPFDDRENLAASINDLDLGLIREHLKEINSSLYEQIGNYSIEELSENLRIIGGPPARKKPLNVGLLMFSEHPEKYFRYARIELVDIPDITGTNMVEKYFTGPIQRQLKDALAYIKNYVIKEVTIKQNNKAEAIKIANYPYRAIKEILSNAVYHRSYQINEPIIIRISPNNIEITSFPGFDRTISDEDVANMEICSRIYRNRRIGDFLKELKLIEGRNTGFPNAINSLKENGSDLLKIKMNAQRDYLTVTIPIHKYFNKNLNNDYEEKIIEVLEDNPLSLTELAYTMGYKGISAKLKNTVSSLNNQKKITLILKDNKPKYIAKK